MREYPSRPIVGVGAVIFLDGQVLLVKRGHEPLAGEWSLPGGAVELGETLRAALVREIREEVGLTVEVGPVIEVVDRITVDDVGVPQYHFVVVDYLCRAVGGSLQPGSDVDEIALADPEALSAYHVTDQVENVVRRAWSREQRF